MTFENFFWRKLPYYYERNDTYPDNSGKGLLQRYLSIFGLELDEKVIPAIEGFINNLDPNTASNELLSLISYSVGQPDDPFDTVDQYRNFLVQIISIYQVKGTFRSYKRLFALLGLNVEVEELFPPDNKYDGELVYDENFRYDDDSCNKNCIHYNLKYQPIPGVKVISLPLTLSKENQLKALIYDLIQPHSAELENLTFDTNINWDTIIEFDNAASGSAEEITATIDEPDLVAEFRFNKIIPRIGLPKTMQFRKPNNDFLCTITYPEDYSGFLCELYYKDGTSYFKTFE